jgi:hypothetical protein
MDEVIAFMIGQSGRSIFNRSAFLDEAERSVGLFHKFTYLGVTNFINL